MKTELPINGVDEHRESDRLEEADRAVVDLIRSGMQWGDRTDADRAAFAARIFERVESRRSWRGPALVTAVVVVATLVLLMAWPRSTGHLDPSQQVVAPSVEVSGRSFPAVAYYGSEGVSELDSGALESDYLPDRYRVWWAALDDAAENENGSS